MSTVGIARKLSKAALLPAGILTRRRPGDLVVLLYHRVGDSGAEIELPVGAFERQLAHLAERLRIAPLDEALAGSEGMVVTFDDGTPDFHERVLPLLVQYRVPATLYLATSLVDGEGGERGRAIGWGQLREAAATGLVTVGSHTHTHVDLRRADERVSEEEMKRSKALIEDRLGRPCRHFAYPYGAGSTAAEHAARRLFDSAALGSWRTNRSGRLDPHRLGRVPILRSDGQAFFRAKVRGLLGAEALVYRALGRGPWREP